MPSRFRQRAINRVTQPVVPTGPFARPKTAIMEMDTGETAAVIAKFDYAYFVSSQVHVDTGTNAGAATTLINAVRAIDSSKRTKFGVYQMASEFPVVGLSFITTVVKSGSTLTLTTRNIQDSANVNFPTGTQTLQLRGFTGSDAPLNGTYNNADLSVSTNTCTISNLSAPRTAVADGTRSNVSIFGARASTVEYNFLTQIGDQPDWFLRKYGAATQDARMTAESTSFPPLMNLSSSTTANGSGKRWGRVCAEYFSTNMINNIGSATDGIEFIFCDNSFDQRLDVANSSKTFTGGAGSSNTDKYNILNTTTWQSMVGGSTDATAMAAHRTGYADYYGWCRSAAASRTKSKTTPFIMGNHDCANGVLTGFENTMEAVFFENAFSQNVGSMSNANRSTNIPSAFGFGCYFNPTTQDATHGWIQQAAPKLLPNPGLVFLGGEITNYNQYEAARFVQCTAWLHTKAVPIVKGAAGTRQAYAEQLCGFGNSVSGNPSGRASWGGYEHTWENAIVLVNDTAGSLTKDLTGTSYRWPDAAALGVADDGINVGGGVINAVITIPAYSARVVVLDQTAGV